APGPAYHVLVRLPELAEVHRLDGLDTGYDQVARPVGPGQVDGDAEVDVLRLDQHRLAVGVGVGVVHLRVQRKGLDQGVPDEVGEADLATAAAQQVVVDHDAVVREQLGRHGAHAGRRRYGQRLVHVGDDPGRDAAQDRGLRPGRQRAGGDLLGRRRRRRILGP